MSRRRGADETGDTFIEVLIASVIIALAAVALLGALVASITSSAEHRSLANIDTVLKSYAENAKEGIELQSPPQYTDCATVDSMHYNSWTIPVPALPSGWSPPYVVGIQYWHSATGTYDSPCIAGDQQLLTVGVKAPDGVSQTLTIGLRSPT